MDIRLAVGDTRIAIVASDPPLTDWAPLLSIITVSLDSASTIVNTIASISQQKCSFKLEHVCVDGGSRDGTREIIDRWSDEHIISVRRIFEPDRGIYDAMNKGLAEATGTYVLFLNSDDYLIAPDILDRALQNRIGACGANFDLIVGGARMGRPGRMGVWRRRRVPHMLAKFRGIGLYPVHQGQFTKRSLLNAVSGFDTRLRLAADLALYYDLERKFEPSIRLLPFDIAFMTQGGAANADWRAVIQGTRELYQHLRKTYSPARSIAMVAVKTGQSISEMQVGTCDDRRWFDPVR